MTLLAVAHRAGNDLAALRTAVELGVDVLEADVKVRGPHLEVRHSKHLRPLPWLWDSGPDGLEWTHTRVPQLKLDALLAALEVGHPTLMLDLKGPGQVGAKVADAIHAREPQTPFLVCSRWWPGLEAFDERPWARQLLTARSRLEFARLRRRVRGTRRPYGVSLHPSLLTPPVVAELRDAVELVMTWGVNDMSLLRRVVDLGVNGVISDSPEVLQAVLARR